MSIGKLRYEASPRSAFREVRSRRSRPSVLGKGVAAVLAGRRRECPGFE